MSRTEKIFLVPDIHCGDVDWKAVDLAAKLCKAFKPHRIIYLGDILDCYWASSYFKKHHLVAGAYKEERDEWDEIRNMFRAPRIQMLLGNHEERIERFISENSSLIGCDDFDLAKVLAPDSNQELVEEDHIVLSEGKFIVTHGFYLGKTAGEKEIHQWGSSGASGHTHSLARTSFRSGNTIRTWVQCGHLSRNPPKYRKRNKPGPEVGWLQGIAILEVEGNSFHIQEIPFTLGYSARIGGKRYSV